MICNRCLRRIARPVTSTPSRTFTSTSTRASVPVTSETTTTTNPRPDGRPAATSRPGVAQPFSTPMTPSPSNQDLPIQPGQTKAAAPRVQSSVPAGTVLKGLNFMKNKQDPVALEDSEYPAWLWGVLEKKADVAGGQGKGDEGDLFSKSKKQRQRAAKALRKRALQNPESLAPKVPLYEQTIDLPSGDGTLEAAKDAGQAREDLTKAMRENRRKKIKTDNFLKAMG